MSAAKKPAATSAKQEMPVLEEVTLAKPHKHEGKELPVGAKIKVSERRKAWLAEREIITTGAE